MPADLRLVSAGARSRASARSVATTRLRRAICAAGLTQAEAGSLVGVDARQVRRWLSGGVPLGAIELLVAIEDHQQHNEKLARRGAIHDWKATRHENPIETPNRSGGPLATGSDRDTEPSEAPGSEQARSRPVSASAQRVAAAALARRGSDDGKRAVAPLVIATASTLSESVGDVDAVCVERAA